MSGETVNDISGWTTDTLKDLILNLFRERDQRFEQRFLAQEVALRSALDAAERRQDQIAEQLLRRTSAERDYIDGKAQVISERIDGMDKATELLNDQMTRFPTDVDRSVGQLRELHGQRFAAVEQQFTERDTRSERESRDNKVAVDAAFAASKEASSEQNKSNTLAIDKSEKATAETLNKQADLFKSTTDALRQQLDDVKASVSEVRQAVNGASQKQVGGTAAYANIATMVFLIIAVVGFGIGLLAKTG